MKLLKIYNVFRFFFFNFIQIQIQSMEKKFFEYTFFFFVCDNPQKQNLMLKNCQIRTNEVWNLTEINGRWKIYFINIFRFFQRKLDQTIMFFRLILYTIQFLNFKINMYKLNHESVLESYIAFIFLKQLATITC